MLKTRFWRKALGSLPTRLQARYRADVEQMERWELALDGAIEVCSRIFAKPLHGKHAH
jgi:hypothetical protein